jgi:uncharacterized protein YceH (UPF0502 family)
MLDPIQQRILGVLFEKERTVPDSYPLTENALLSGCNQKSNRDPEMFLDATTVHPALLALREGGYIARVESGGRAVRYRHRLLERLNVSVEQMVVLAELMLRGPQAPGALKPRVARMGLEAEPARILEILESLAAQQPVPLVERLPRLPRERDHRFEQRLGPRAEGLVLPEEGEDVEVLRSRPAAPATDGLALRVERLEAEVAALRQLVDELRGEAGPGG